MNLKTLTSRAATLGSLPGGSTHDHAEWLIGPVGQHRDSDSIAESNFRSVVREMRKLDPYELDHEVHRFGHFAVGWVEEIATRPGSACATFAGQVRTDLASYPIFDEDDHSALESEQVSENMSAIMSDLRRDLIKLFVKRNAADPSDENMSDDEISDALDDLDDDKLYEVAADHAIEQRDGWEYYNTSAIADALVEKGLI